MRFGVFKCEWWSVAPYWRTSLGQGERAKSECGWWPQPKFTDKNSVSVDAIWTQIGVFQKNDSLEWKNKGNRHRQVAELSDWKINEEDKIICENVELTTIRWTRFPKLLNFSKKTTCMNAMKKILWRIQIERKMQIPDLLQKNVLLRLKNKTKSKDGQIGKYNEFGQLPKKIGMHQAL